jgi:SAM-dependent methyltransferase
MPFSQLWEDTYSKGLQNSRWPWSQLVSFAHRLCDLGPGLRVLELGCGMGANVPFFLAKGSDYHAIDGSQTAIRSLHKEFPSLKKNIVLGDFSKNIPFGGQFDLVFDRAALTHNTLSDVRSCLKGALSALKPGGIYIGISWFSKNNSYAKRGKAHPQDSAAIVEFVEGPYKGIEPMRFFEENEIFSLFEGLKLIEIEEEIVRKKNPDETVLSAWNFAFRKAE